MNERQLANLEIIEKLRAYFLKNPDQRFHQGLANLSLLNRVQKHMGGQTWDFFYVDEAHTESVNTLDRVNRRMKEFEDSGII